MNIKVNSCTGCPFYQVNYDDFALGYAWTHTCGLILNTCNGEINYFIDFYKNGNVKSKNRKTLDNCPLLKENINVEYGK